MHSKLSRRFNILTAATILTVSTLFPIAALANSNSPASQEVAAQQAACACFNVEVVGTGPAILLLPGVASSGEVWQSTVEALQDKYQLHVFTLAGFAGVKPIPMQSWGEGYLATQQQAILGYIAAQQLDKPIIIGHSLGGYLALALATTAPDQVGGVINVDGLPALGAMLGQSATGQNNTASNADSKAQPPRGGFDPMAMAKGMTNNEQWQQRIVQDMYRSDGQTSGRVFGELMRADLRPQLANIRVPVLTLGALQNGAPYSTPESVQKNYENQLANAPAQFHSFAFSHDAKHFIMADAPQWMNQQISRFLATIPAGKEAK